MGKDTASQGEKIRRAASKAAQVGLQNNQHSHQKRDAEQEGLSSQEDRTILTGKASKNRASKYPKLLIKEKQTPQDTETSLSSL